MSRLATLALLALALAGAPAAAQDPAPVLQLAVGATFGSLAGVRAWSGTAGPERGDVRSTMLLAATTTLGSALGAWLITGAGREPALETLIPAAGIGVMGGMVTGAAAMYVFQSSEGVVVPLILGYVVGQGLTTALLGRPPRAR